MADFGISLGISLSLQFLSAALTPPTEGPKLTSKKVPKSDYGQDIPRIRGVYPVTAQIIWSPKEYREERRKRGKIGGKSIEYVYYGDFAYALNVGPFAGFNRLKFNGDTKINYLSTKADKLKSSTQFQDQYLEIYPGDETQMPCPTMQAADGAGNVPAYRGLSYVFVKNYPLTDTGNRPPSLEAIAYSQGTVETQSFLAGNYKPITWVSLNGATIDNAPDDPLLGRCSFATGTNKGAHSATDFLDLSTGSALEVNFVVQGQGTYGLNTSVPVGSYSAAAIDFAFNLTATNLVVWENGVQEWVQTPMNSHSRGTRLSIKVDANRSLTYWVDGLKIYTSMSYLAPTATLWTVAVLDFGTVGGLITVGSNFSSRRINPTPVNLRSLLSEITEIGGVTSIDYGDIPDTAQLLGIGLAASGSPKDWIEQLQKLYFFDVFQRGNTLVFKRAHRGAPVRSLTLSDLASAQLNNTRPLEFEYKSPNPSTLPGEVSLKYYDARDSNLRQKTVYARFETNPSREKNTLSVDAALTTEQAQAIADVSLCLRWLQKTVKFKIAMDHCDLEPGDVVTVPLWGVDKRVLITKMVLGANLLYECEAETQEDSVMDRLVMAPDFKSLATGYGGVFDQTYLALLKIPKIRDNDPNTLVYFGVGGGGKSWATAFLNASPDGTNWDTIAQTTAEGVLGVSNTVLPSATAVGVDSTSTLIVRLYAGELSTITLDAFNAGGVTNLLLIGEEIVRFRDALLIGTNTYRLSYFDRGRNATPMNTHALHERVVLLSTVQAVALEPDQVGTYQAKLTFDQQTLDEVVSIPVTL